MNKEELFEVIKDAKTGSQKAFSILYKTIYNQVYNHVFSLVRNKEDAEDITSESIAKAFTKIHRYENNISFLMWMKTIAVNTVIDFVRRKHMNVINNSVDMDGDCSDLTSRYDLSPEDSYINLERRAIVEKNVDRLNGTAKQVVLNRYTHGLSYKEIAKKLGLSIGTVKAHISKTTKKIKPKN